MKGNSKMKNRYEPDDKVTVELNHAQLQLLHSMILISIKHFDKDAPCFLAPNGGLLDFVAEDIGDIIVKIKKGMEEYD